MTCHHSKGDPNCSSNRPYVPPEPKTPDKKKFVIIDAEEVGAHLVMKIKYPNCKNCSFEGEKVIVFSYCNAIGALKWTEIDPHFRDPQKACLRHEAPSPVARFPASDVGWTSAVAFANSIN